MGKSFHYKMIFILLVALHSNFSLAAEPSNLNSTTGAPENINCGIKFESLVYVGLNFVDPARCVYAKNGAEALKKCLIVDNGRFKRLINPGNPQYQSEIKGDLRDNPENYYYCVSGAMANDKKYACLNLAPKYSKYLKEQPTIVFTWDKKGNKDGDCLCSSRGDDKKFNCDQAPPNFEKKCETLGLTEVDFDEYHDMPGGPFGDLGKGYPCKCKDGRYVDVKVAKDSCAEVQKEPAKEVAKPAATEAVDDVLKTCIKTWNDQALKCKEAAESAGKSCGTGAKMSKEEKEQVAAIDAANKALTAPKAGKGMQEECFTSSLVASGAKTALTGSKESCESDITACTSSCSEEGQQKLKAACFAKISLLDDGTTPDLSYFEKAQTETEEIYQDARKLCVEDAKKSQFSLDSLLSKVGDALSSSVKCMCQTSASGGDCNAIPTVAACNANPGSPGCGVYGSVAVCTPGGGYDAHLCDCQMNPKGAGCPGGGASGGLTGFASPKISNNGIGDSGGNVMASGIKATSAFPDVPTSNGTSGSTDNQYQIGANALPGGNAAAGGGGSGGSGGGGGSGPAAAAAEPAAEEKGLGGLFNQAKSFLSNAFGKNKKSPSGKANSSNSKNANGSDPNRLRPMRGIASKTGFGSKNQDIWKMSNDCIYAETCPGNNNSFLEVPLKHK